MGIKHVLALVAATPWELRHRLSGKLEDLAYIVRGEGKLRAEELEELRRDNARLRKQLEDRPFQDWQQQMTDALAAMAREKPEQLLGRRVVWLDTPLSNPCTCPECTKLRQEQPS